MSIYESENGTVILPAAAFSKVRKAMELEDKRLRELGLEFAQTLWGNVPASAKKNKKEYWKEIEEQSGTSWNSSGAVPSELRSKRLSREEVSAVVEHAHQVLRLAEHHGGAPSRPQKKFANLPTNRTTEFSFEEAEVVFDKKSNTISWYVDRNNHSVDRAHSDPRFEVLSRELKDVRWTRNTGGTIYYENEYQDDGNRPSRAYGPNGAVEHPLVCIPYTMANGFRVTEHWLRDIADKQLQAARKAFKASRPIAHGSGSQPRGHKGHAGQYTYRTSGQSDVWL